VYTLDPRQSFMASNEGPSGGSDEVHPQHQRSRSSTTKVPSKKNFGGFIATLRQKLTPSRTLSRIGYEGREDVNCRHKIVAEESSVTLCSSWRATRPRQVENPTLRPAYSDECLSCCTGARCRRSARSVHQDRRRVVEPSLARPKKVCELVVAKVPSATSSSAKCIHCHSKNDRSPSEAEPPSEADASPTGEEVICKDIFPIETAYGASAYGHASAPVVTTPGEGASSSFVVSEIAPSSSCDGQATLHSHGGERTLSRHHVCEVHELTCEPPIVLTTVVPLAQPFYDQVKEHVGGAASAAGKGWSLSKELFRLSNYGWYWGPITRIEAEDKLAGQTDGAFLVRDSSDDRYLLSLSFRSFGRTLHTRIEHCNGVFSFYAQPESEGYGSIVDLIEHSMTDSQSGVFCYSRARVPGSPSFPVRLAKPLSRFAQVRTLQYLCRFVIRQYTRVDHIQQLPLPFSIKGWLEEGQY